MTGKFDALAGTAKYEVFQLSISKILSVDSRVTCSCSINTRRIFQYSIVQYPERTSLTLPKLRSRMYPTPFFFRPPPITCCPSSSLASSRYPSRVFRAEGKCKVAISPKSNARRQTMVVTETSTEVSRWCHRCRLQHCLLAVLLCCCVLWAVACVCGVRRD